MKNLYRRYRPLKLDDVVGQQQVTKPLDSSLKQGKISHAYLFIGPRGTGKTSVARIFAHEVNGFKYELEDNYVDIVEIDGASNRGIDNIRELREKAAIAPTKGKYKIYIIDEVHMLTKEAFNALLKTLEEPPAHVIFIMATTDAYKVPVTITSRAQTYTFKLADQKTILDFLKSVAKQEKISITDEALEIIAKKGGGSFRDSLSLLDQISTLSNDEIDKDLVLSALGLPEDEKITDLLNEYLTGDLNKITIQVKDLLVSGIKADTLAEKLIEQIVDEPRPELLPLLAKLPGVKDPFAEAKLLVALANEQPKAEIPVVTPNTSVKKNFNFNWQELLNKIEKLNEAVHSQLKHCEYELKGNVLHLYPNNKTVLLILDKPNNKAIIKKAMPDIEIEIHKTDERPEAFTKDETLTKISDIMGGEVKNDQGGYNPF